MTRDAIIEAAKQTISELNLPWSVDDDTDYEILVEIYDSVPYAPDGTCGLSFWLTPDSKVSPSMQICNSENTDFTFDRNYFINDMVEAREAGESDIPSREQVEADARRLEESIEAFADLMDAAEDVWIESQKSAARAFGEQIEQAVNLYAKESDRSIQIENPDAAEWIGYHKAPLGAGADGTRWEVTAVINGLEQTETALPDAIMRSELTDGRIECAHLSWVPDGSGVWGNSDMKLFAEFWVPFAEKNDTEEATD